MNNPITNSEKRWYCVEIVDEQEIVHSILSLYTDEATATRVLGQADRQLPDSAHIYYWRADQRPAAFPPNGYDGGPMTRPDGPFFD